MKTKIFIIGVLALSLGLFACGSSRQTGNNDVVEHLASPYHTSKIALDWAGVYAGILPCADCEGIETIITLNEDMTYVIATRYLGKGDNQFVERQGTFEWYEDGNRIRIGDITYLVGENILFHLDRDGNRITGDLADNYMLHRVDEVEQTADSQQLIGVRWRLVELHGQEVVVTEFMQTPHLILHAEDNRVSGNGGCNNFFGSFELNKEHLRISFSQMGATMMACIEGMDIEAKFLGVLSEVDNFNLGNNTLSLNRARMAPLARFVAN